MWESASSISKVCGKGGKQHHRFPGFPQTVISTACLDHLELSGGGLHRSIDPVLLELDRAYVVQRRVHSCSVIPEQPGDGFILGLADGFKAPAMQSLYLQRTKQRLRAGVVPAVALAAHRRRNAMLFEYLAEVVAGVLAAAIAMKAQPCILTWVALQPSHLQSIDHQAALHIRPHRPAHHFAAEQIDNYSQEQPAFLGCDVGKITDPDLVGSGHDELAIKHVGRNRQLVPAVGGDHAETPLAARLNAVLLHQSLHPQLAHANPLRPQLSPDARPPIRTPILCIDGADVNRKCFVAEVAALGNIHATRQLRTQTTFLHLLSSHLRLAAGALQGASSMLPDPVAQGLLNHAQTACCRRLALARLYKPRRLLLEFKRVPAPLTIPHLRYPFALEQLAKGYVLRGQGHWAYFIPIGPRNSRTFSLASNWRLNRMRATHCPWSSFFQTRAPPNCAAIASGGRS